MKFEDIEKFIESIEGLSKENWELLKKLVDENFKLLEKKNTVNSELIVFKAILINKLKP